MESLDSGDDGKNSNRTKMMSIGRKKFNMDPKKGIEYLIEKGLLQVIVLRVGCSNNRRIRFIFSILQKALHSSCIKEKD